MNSRERVRATLNHQEPDLIPCDLGGDQSSIHIKAYKKLLQFLDIKDQNIRYADYVEQNVVPCEELLQRFEVDTRYVRPFNSMLKDDFKPKHEGKYVGIFDQFGVFFGDFAYKDPDDILYYDPVIHPLSDFKTVQEIENYNWPDGTDKTPFRNLREYAKKLREKTNYALVSPPIGCIFENCFFLFGFTKALKLFRTKPELILATMKCLLKYWIDYNVTFLGEVGEYLDVVCVNGDLAEQHGPIMSIEQYEKTIKPIEGELSKKIHKLASVKINYHSCGSIPDFIPHFADIGYDACNPVQISAEDMEPCSLKKRFGNMITFWGGTCNAQQTLPFGTPEQIKKEVKYNLNCFKPGGGYIAASIHNITAEVPPENIIAMFDAIREFRNY